MQEVKRESTSQKPDLEFKYDPMGQRIAKIEKTKETNGNLKPAEDWNTTYYVRDAQGNVMSVYKQKTEVCDSEPCTAIILAEQHIYGSSRLGLRRPDATLAQKTQYGFITLDETDFLKFKRKLGGKEYELTNHLGNVMAVVTDRKITVQGANISCFMWSKPMTDFYIPNVVSYSDYYPFGMQMPGRNDAVNSYRYKHQGQESDPEIYGEGNSYAYTYRMSDARLGRFWSIDPLAPQYAYNSPYAYSENRLLDGVELEGLEWKRINNGDGTPVEGKEGGYEWDNNWDSSKEQRGTVPFALYSYKGDDGNMYTRIYSTNYSQIKNEDGSTTYKMHSSIKIMAGEPKYIELSPGEDTQIKDILGNEGKLSLKKIKKKEDNETSNKPLFGLEVEFKYYAKSWRTNSLLVVQSVETNYSSYKTPFLDRQPYDGVPFYKGSTMGEYYDFPARPINNPFSREGTNWRANSVMMQQDNNGYYRPLFYFTYGFKMDAKGSFSIDSFKIFSIPE